MAPSTQNIREKEEDDIPLRYKRRRLTQPDSQSQRPLHRFRSQIVHEEEDDEDFIRVGDFISIDSNNSEQCDQQQDDNRHNLDLNLDLDLDDDQLIPNIVTNKSSLINGGSLRLMLTDPEVLICPICLDQLLSPVFQCENGHIACNSCFMKLKRKCPYRCMLPMGRCRGVEKFIESISKISCKYADVGCKKMIPYGKKIEHEQICPNVTCTCPYSSCQFVDCSKNMYSHFGINHTPVTRFTYDETFLVDVDTSQSHIFLQEENENVIFILNQEVLAYGRVFNVDCVGSGLLNNSFQCKISVGSMDTSSLLSFKSVPKVYTEWSRSSSSLLKDGLMVSFEYTDYDEVISLSICIKKVNSFEFDVEEDVDEEVKFVNRSIQVVMNDFDAFVCSICDNPLFTAVFQCQDGRQSCSSCCIKGYLPGVYQRCRGLERVLESVRISCKNAKDGCEETMTYSSIKEHEQKCPYSTCFCPETSCPFYGSYKDVYIHFDIAHAYYASSFTYNTRFSVCVGINQKHVFLQEQHEGAIFIVNQEVREDERAFNVEYVGSSTFKWCLKYQMTAKRMVTLYSLEAVPQMFIKGPKHSSKKKDYLRVPFEFADDKGLLSVFVTIIKE